MMAVASRTSQEWQAVLDCALAGDPESFGDFWDDYLVPRHLRSYALKLFGNLADAQDLIQSIFVHLYEQKRYRQITRRDVDGFVAYIRTMIYNLYVDLRREETQIRYWVSDQSVEQLRLAQVPEEILDLVTTAPPLPPVGKQAFRTWLMDTINQDLTPALETVFFRYSRWEEPRVEALAPDAVDQQTTVHSVQVELEQHEIRMIFEQEVRPTLSAEEWLAFEARHGTEPVSYRELAERTGIPRSTLHDYYERAKQKILTHPKLRTYWEA